jgi:hypothetical protein
MAEPQAQSGESGVLAHVDRSVVDVLEDFADPSHEWRRLFSELLGTFFLVLVAAGGGMMGQAFPDTISRTAAVVAPGLMVMSIILFMGKVSGAHLNPAVSIGFALRGDFPWRRVPSPSARGSKISTMPFSRWFSAACTGVDAMSVCALRTTPITSRVQPSSDGLDGFPLIAALR